MFPVVDITKTPLIYSPSPFILPAWGILLQHYPGPLYLWLVLILQFGCLFGYEGPPASIHSKNLTSALLDPQIIAQKLQDDLGSGRVIPATQKYPFISSPLGLVPKPTGGLRRIHHLSHPRGTSVNDFISKEASHLRYTSLTKIIDLILQAGRHCVIIKKDIKDAFRNIPVAPHVQWLLGFSWDGKTYQETCLPFGLATSPFIFNLFAEALHWMLHSYLGWTTLEHYLDDFIRVLSHKLATKERLTEDDKAYCLLTDCLGVPRQEAKDVHGTVVMVFGLEVDTNLFIVRVPADKLARASEATSKALSQPSVTLKEIQSLTGFLSFCAQAVRLGWVFMRHLWDFVASYPRLSSQFTQKRLTAEIREDLIWWNELLPTHNGVLFFDNQARPVFQLYTDACLEGLGGFYYLGDKLFWDQTTSSVEQKHAFIASISNSTHINIHELDALLVAFNLWVTQWQKSKLIIYTDNTTAYNGLQNLTLRGSANKPLRKILLLAAQNDISIEARWIRSSDNGLADALSRSNFASIANLCPHWQPPLASIVLHPNSLSLSHI